MINWGLIMCVEIYYVEVIEFIFLLYVVDFIRIAIFLAVIEILLKIFERYEKNY
jgi:hypothetical protein